jgi:hypothetical protein
MSIVCDQITTKTNLVKSNLFLCAGERKVVVFLSSSPPTTIGIPGIVPMGLGDCVLLIILGLSTQYRTY